jgi:bifunctional polynucleotide phosphatase/kinase
MYWSETNNYLKGIDNNLDELSDPVRVASFDLDDTIIHRPKGKGEKWQFIKLDIKKKIAELVANNYIIVIFTNQGGMSRGKNFDKPKWRKAIEELKESLTSEIPNNKYYFAVYVAKNYDLYRKPNLGLWNLMKEDLKEEFHLDKIGISNKSFFCGDAAGRISASPYKKKAYPSTNKGDFSDTDIKFAMNIGIKFYTPEEFFIHNPPKMEYKLSGINPKEMLEEILENDEKYNFKPRTKEMIIMVGQPGSGKTDFVIKYIKPYGYVHINQDTCKTRGKCLALTKEALEKNKSIVIDNTNPNIESRNPYISLAMDYGYKHIRAIIINTDEAMAKHLNNVRHIYSNGSVPKINDIVYRIFNKIYIKPQSCEHFDKIETVDFIFDVDRLKDIQWKKSFLKWSEY